MSSSRDKRDRELSNSKIATGFSELGLNNTSVLENVQRALDIVKKQDDPSQKMIRTSSNSN
jgi:hypothetical protein